MKGRDDIPGFNRRTVLKSAAVAAVGVGAFSGTASANEAEQINFCGCSQVCVVMTEAEAGFQVILAEEADDGWEFSLVPEDRTEKLPNRTCYEVEDSDQKIVAVRPYGKGGLCGGQMEELYCNPGQCAQKALTELKSPEFCPESEDPNYADRPKCVTEEFGTVTASPEGEESYDVTIVQGRCGEAGKSPPGRRGR